MFAKTFFAKFRGLMFRSRRSFNYALVFNFERASKKAASIHMFFVFFPIDVVYLKGGKVVDTYRSVMPFTAYLAPKARADTLIELPQGSIWQAGIKLKDTLSIE